MGCIIKIGNQSVSETDFLNHLNKIISVNKLFEENPKFSSQIYEALGFKQFKFEHLSKYSNLSDFTLNKKEEAVNFLQSLDGKKLFSPSEMLSRISNADTSRINKGLSDYLNSILEQYQGIYAEELINPYRIEFKEQLKLGDDRDDTIGDLRGYNQAGYKAINLTNIESNDLIKTILHEFVHDIEPYVLFKESKLIRFTKTKGSNTPLTEEQLKIGNQLENLRKLVIKHLAEEFKNKKPDSLKNEIERLENGGLITIYGELKKPTLVYINNLKNELNAVNRLIETNKVEEFIENNKQFFLNNEYNHYGVTNLNEFITEALTNDKFRKLLNEIPYKNTTILSYLFELFQKILGIKKDTVLSEALNLIHEVATTKRGQLRDFQITPQQKQQAQQLYSQYLDTIFPDSKVKDVVYHGTKSPTKFERFINVYEDPILKKEGRSELVKGVFFVKEKNIAEAATKKITEDYKINKVGHIISAIIDFKNPKYDNKGYEYLSKDRVEKLQKEGFDGFITQGNGLEHIVFEPEQIHILGSKQDIEGFKQFVNKNTTQVVDNNQLQKQNIFTVNPIQSADKKAIVKASVANKYIGFAEGIEGSSTAEYARQINEQNNGKIDNSKKINIYSGTNENKELSNLADRPFTLQGVEYDNVEQYFQLQKFQTAGVLEFDYDAKNVQEIADRIHKVADAIANTKSGFEAKKLGGTRIAGTTLNEKFWNSINSEEMKKAIKASFEQNPKALQQLLATGNAELTHTQESVKSKWRTEFPKLLMEVRNELSNNSNIVNSGDYNPSDIVFVSIPGKRGDETVRKEQQDKTIREALKAIEAGATLITDNKSYVENSDYNEGEKRLAKNLEAKGYNYSEQTIDGKVLGIWNKNNSKEYKNEGIIPVIRNNDSRFKPISPSDIDENITPCDK